MASDGAAAAPSTPPREVVAGRYRVTGRLGRGGMGTVWQATDELLRRQVAVKELHLPDSGLTARQVALLRERALREARSAALIRHPHVVVVHDVVEHRGRPWIVMELIDGWSLAYLMEQDGPLDPREAARVGAAVADALDAAHGQDIQHRDVKPANVLLERDSGRVVLTDFGIARMPGGGTISETGAFVGSPEYTAPERMSGRGAAGPASDLWSLGALLCAAVHGESPFHRESIGEIVHAVAFGSIAAPDALGPLLPVVTRLLDREPLTRLGAADARRLLEIVAETGEPPAPDALREADRGEGQAAPDGQEADEAAGEARDRAPRDRTWDEAGGEAPQDGPEQGGAGAVPTAAEASPALPALPAFHVPPSPQRLQREADFAFTAQPLPPAEPVSSGSSLPSVALPGGSSGSSSGSSHRASGRRRGSGVRIVAVSALVVLAVGAGATATVLVSAGDRDRGPAAGPQGAGSPPPQGDGSPPPAPSGSPPPGPDGSPPPRGPDGPPFGIPAPDGRHGPLPGSPGTPPLPRGYHDIIDPSGFSVALPDGYVREVRPPVVFYWSPDRSLRFGERERKPDPRGPHKALAAQVATAPADFHGYRDGTVTDTLQFGQPAAQWEFTYDGLGDGRGVRHVIELYWTDAGREYDIWLSAPLRMADAARTVFGTARDTFREP